MSRPWRNCLRGAASSFPPENRKARHDYNIVEAMEAGMELVGTEVKSLRAGKVNLKDSFVRITKKGELVVMNMHISPYDFGNYNNHDPLRTRRLLMHRREIDYRQEDLRQTPRYGRPGREA